MLRQIVVLYSTRKSSTEINPGCNQCQIDGSDVYRTLDRMAKRKLEMCDIYVEIVSKRADVHQGYTNS